MYIRQSRAIGRKQQQEVQKNTSWKQICKQKNVFILETEQDCFMYSKIVFKIKLYTVSKRFLN